MYFESFTSDYRKIDHLSFSDRPLDSTPSGDLAVSDFVLSSYYEKSRSSSEDHTFSMFTKYALILHI